MIYSVKKNVHKLCLRNQHHQRPGYSLTRRIPNFGTELKKQWIRAPLIKDERVKATTMSTSAMRLWAVTFPREEPT